MSIYNTLPPKIAIFCSILAVFSFHLQHFIASLAGSSSVVIGNTVSGRRWVVVSGPCCWLSLQLDGSWWRDPHNYP